jgi:HD-GYP domain-containing protein (c-di-GMP phosphodiesterase class II)
LRHLADFVRYHHERWDGAGYPDRLRGEQIPLEARIIAISDAVESMATKRPYHHAMDLAEIVEELARCAGSQFDPAIAEVFVRILRRDGEGIIGRHAN